MKRVQLFEFEDQSWFPDWMRVSLTRLILVLHKMVGFSDMLSTILDNKIRRLDSNTIVDLGSGAGGPMIDVFKTLKSKYGYEQLQLTLTDLYPSKATISRINSLNEKGLTYHNESVDATKMNSAPKGIKTMINSFHHMPVDAAKNILRSAAENKEPIFIYEMADNKIPLILWWLLLPISLVIMIVMVLFMTPFVQPLTGKQLLFTYLVPIIPIAYAWDGQASMPRIYAIKDYPELLEGIDQSEYSFKIEVAKNSKGKAQGYFVFGYPKTNT